MKLRLLEGRGRRGKVDRLGRKGGERDEGLYRTRDHGGHLQGGWDSIQLEFFSSFGS